VPDEWAQLTIRDDGRNAGTVIPHPDHLGIYGMRESARAAGGELVIQSLAGVGTSVVFSFPAE